MIVRDEAQYKKLYTLAGEYMTPTARKKLFQRKKKPDGMPDWGAIETHIKNCGEERGTVASSVDAMSLEERIAFFEAQYAEAEPGSDEWIDAHDALQQLRQTRQGSES